MKEYTVIYEKGLTSWGAYIPDLPGCVAAAATREEAEKLIREAIELHVEDLTRRGEIIPAPASEAGKITVAA